MRAVMPIDDMLHDLRQFDGDEDGYVERWRFHLASIGGGASGKYEHDGTLSLMVGHCCDGQSRHRARWIHFLSLDLFADDQRRKCLLRTLVDAGLYVDNRPANPGQTTRAMRDYLRTGGRLLIDPRGKLREGGGLPAQFFNGTDEQSAEVIRAAKVLNDVRKLWRTEHQIKRAVRMLGEPTPNGWIVLEAMGPGGAVAC